VQLFDAHTGEVIGRPLSVPAGSNKLQFSADNSLLAVKAQQATTLYDLKSGQVIGDAFPSSDYAFLRPDGKELATATSTGVLLWDLDPDGWQATACQLAGRNLTPTEWNRYLSDAGPYRATCPQWRFPND
jgi:hypothetical protein